MDDSSERLHEHSGLVVRIARQIRSRYAQGADFDEMFAAGMAGLIEAERAFDPNRGVAFSTFAYHRIRGAVIDNCRRLGHMRRIYRQRADFDSAATEIVASQPPPTGELDQAQRAEWVAGTIDAMATAFILTEAEGDYADEGQRPADETVETGELVRLLREAIPRLEPTSREVVHRHYFEGMPFADIAREMGVSRSTISRVHQRALEELRPVVVLDDGS